MWLLTRILRRLVRFGRLDLIDADGRTHVFQGAAGPAVTLRLHDRRVAREIALNPQLRLGEAYMDGRVSIEGATIYEFLDFASLNSGGMPVGPVRWLRPMQVAFRRWMQANSLGRARRNVAHHYDLSDELYELFLDRDRQYSCAYFVSGNDTLDVAQDNKKRHIAAKLLLRPGVSVLDIGSGWGGLGLHLARVGAGRVVGVTLSEEQHKASNARAAAAGLDGRVSFQLKDYRHETGVFDRIVSVGMFEHVGIGHYAEFFAKLRDLLAEDGVALLHTIGRAEGPGASNPWMTKYIFPGGYCPALSEMLPAIERSGLIVTDVEVLRLHYAETLREWRRRFLERRARVQALYDERFVRMWEFYLAAMEVVFRRDGYVVFQVQLARRIDTVPLTRDYIHEWERNHLGTANLAT